MWPYQKIVGGGGGGGGVGKQIYFERRQVSFMYFIDDIRIFVLSAKFIVSCPYR